MSLDVVSTLQELVRIPSVNPMGREVAGDIYYEHRLTEYLIEFFTQLGVPFVIQDVAPLRRNIIAKIDGRGDPDIAERILMFEAHQDTVPVEGMTIPPWSADLRDGKIYGRGACDVKGGMAAMLNVFSNLWRQQDRQHPTFVMACTVDEEFAATRGVADLFHLWRRPPTFLTRVPNAAIVAEPTMLDIVVAHKGALRWRCQTSGRAAHSSRPADGDNAIYRMSRVLAALQRYAENQVPNLGNHRLLGTPSLSVGVIAGGISVNTVPDRCTIEIDRRLLPSDDAKCAYQHVIEFLTHELPDDAVFIHHDEPFLTSGALDDSQNRQLAEHLAKHAKPFGGGKSIGVNFGTNAPALAVLGIPTVVFGPGSITQAHTADEWLAVEQLLAATEVLESFARSWS